jgi:protein-disulfide isomerase
LSSRKEQREQARREREQREAAALAVQRRNRRLWQVGAGLAVAVVVVVIAIVVSGSGSDTKVQPKETRQTQSLLGGIAQNGITLGNPNAKVTMYEFADLQCPFCREYTTSSNLFPQLVEKYVKTGKVKMVWRNLTFIGSDSITAARYAISAGQQNKLWDFADLFYKNQGTENSGYVTDKFLNNISKGAGADPNKVAAGANSPVVEKELGDAQQQANQYGINSTPSFLLQTGNQKPQKLDYQSFSLAEFSKAIDAALAKAQ